MSCHTMANHLTRKFARKVMKAVLKIPKVLANQIKLQIGFTGHLHGDWLSFSKPVGIQRI